MILAFFEPINKFDIDNIKNKIKFETLIVTETIILMFLILENLFDIGHRRLMRESGENYWSIVRRNKKTAIKCVINFIFLSDFLSFYIKYPESPFRYSRILRPCIT